MTNDAHDSVASDSKFSGDLTSGKRMHLRSVILALSFSTYDVIQRHQKSNK